MANALSRKVDFDDCASDGVSDAHWRGEGGLMHGFISFFSMVDLS